MLALLTLLAVGPIVSLILAIAILGVLVWVLTAFVPMAEPFKRAIYVVSVVVIVVILIKFVIEYLGPYLNF